MEIPMPDFSPYSVADILKQVLWEANISTVNIVIFYKDKYQSWKQLVFWHFKTLLKMAYHLIWYHKLLWAVLNLKPSDDE